MKKLVLMLAIVILAIGSSGLAQKASAYTRVNISVFYSALSPYGEWIDYRDYGLCWRPTVVGVGWRPYTHGRWVWTEYGWTWVSDYAWGWAPFHYGRWAYDDYYGWIWVPDDVWGPAWVDWRYSDTYIGWAPLPPAAQFQIGIGISFGGYSIPHFGWSFTYCSGFLGSSLAILPFHRNVVLIRGTHRLHGIGYRDSRIYNNGPRVDFVERVTRTRVRRSAIVEDRNFGERRGNRLDGERLYIHRPDFGRTRDGRPPVGVERESRRGLRSRELRNEERQGGAGQRESRPREYSSPERERRSVPELQKRSVPERQGRSEGRGEQKSPNRSNRERQERSERPSRGR